MNTKTNTSITPHQEKSRNVHENANFLFQFETKDLKPQKRIQKICIFLLHLGSMTLFACWCFKLLRKISITNKNNHYEGISLYIASDLEMDCWPLLIPYRLAVQINSINIEYIQLLPEVDLSTKTLNVAEC